MQTQPLETPAMANPDVGARVVSDRIALRDMTLPGRPYVTGLSALAGVGMAASGDGALWRFDLTGASAAPERVLDLGAMPLAQAAAPGGGGVIVGTDDGRLLQVDAGGGKRLLAYQAGGWVEQIAVHGMTGRIACSIGRRLLVLDAAGAVLSERPDHPSTIAGVAFSDDGGQVAVSHYGGVTVWPTEGANAISERLEWHGSHLAIAWSPDGAFIATAMQEKELHAWRMPQGKSLRMSGYPAKIRSLSWTPDGRHLAVGGADVATVWDFGGGAPSGKAPMEFGYVFNQVVTEVAANPRSGEIAAAYDDGAILIGETSSGDALIARPGDGAPVTRLAWTPDGAALVAGAARGGIAVMRRRDATV